VRVVAPDAGSVRATLSRRGRTLGTARTTVGAAGARAFSVRVTPSARHALLRARSLSGTLVVGWRSGDHSSAATMHVSVPR
jgi:hypothetical protein